MDKNNFMPSQVRRILLTINNPADRGYTFETVHDIITSGLKSTVYYVISRERGLETGTEHFHLYCVFRAPVRVSTITNVLSGCHYDKPNGTHSECRAYVTKTGKWAESEKATTNLEWEEHGDLPADSGGSSSKATMDELHALIVSGASDAEIYQRHPAYMIYASQIERVRHAISQENARSAPRELTVTYIERRDGRGSQYVFDRHGYVETYRVLNYLRGPFDGYIESQHTALCLDFYASSFDLPHLLAYSSPEPVELEARFHHKWAAYRYLYISSTLPLMSQHKDEQADKQQLWQAFLSRISTVVVYDDTGVPTEYTMDDYRKHIAASPRFSTNGGFGCPSIAPPPAGQTTTEGGGGLSG